MITSCFMLVYVSVSKPPENYRGLPVQRYETERKAI